VRLLLEKHSFGHVLPTTSHYGTNPLMVAVENGHHEVVQFLIEEGGDPHHRNDRGDTAFTLAEKSGNQSLVRLLEQHLKP